MYTKFRLIHVLFRYYIIYMLQNPKGTALYQVQLNNAKIVMKSFGSEAIGAMKFSYLVIHRFTTLSTLSDNFIHQVSHKNNLWVVVGS